MRKQPRNAYKLELRSFGRSVCAPVWILPWISGCNYLGRKSCCVPWWTVSRVRAKGNLEAFAGHLCSPRAGRQDESRSRLSHGPGSVVLGLGSALCLGVGASSDSGRLFGGIEEDRPAPSGKGAGSERRLLHIGGRASRTTHAKGHSWHSRVTLVFAPAIRPSARFPRFPRWRRNQRLMALATR